MFNFVSNDLLSSQPSHGQGAVADLHVLVDQGFHLGEAMIKRQAFNFLWHQDMMMKDEEVRKIQSLDHSPIFELRRSTASVGHRLRCHQFSPSVKLCL